MNLYEAKAIESGPRGKMIIGERSVDCALGKGGTIAANDKREGDHKSPIGTYPIRKVYWREDRGPKPISPFETIALGPNFGWCDAADDANYNKFVTHPYPKSAEKLWRDDELYDIIVVLGHNDDPVVASMGSAIFLHCAKSDYSPTEGCVALYNCDLRELLQNATSDCAIRISD